MRKKWAERNKDRIDKALEFIGAAEDETSETPEVAGHQIVTYYHKRVGGNEPTGGQALYFVCRVDRQKNTVTLMDALLNTFLLSRRAFEEGLVHVYWPEEQRTDLTSGVHCDPMKYAATIERHAKMFAEMGRSFDQLLVRRSIAELRGTTLDKIPQFKTKAKQGEKVMAEYQKRAKALEEEWDESEEQDEEETPKAKKKLTSKTSKAAAKAARKNESEDEEVTTKKSKKGNGKAKAKSNGTRTASEHATPKVGTVYEANFKGKTYTMKVVKEDGEIAYRVGKNTYSSPSAAGKAVIGGACNGWRFWHID